MSSKRFLLITSLLVSSTVNAQSYTSAEHFFIDASAGWQQGQDNSYQHHNPNGAIWHIGGGYQLTPEWSWSTGYQYAQPLKSINNESSIKSSFLTSTLRYDLWISPSLSLYGEAGAAYAFLKKESANNTWHKKELRPLTGFGVQYKITPQISGQLGYKYIPHLGAGNGQNGTMGEYDSHAVMFGLTFKFNAIAPSVAPSLETKNNLTLAKSIPTSTIVYFAFDSDSPQYTPEFNAYINALKTHGSTVTVSGFTDEIGSEQYNKQLSQQRANNVARELIESGIQPSRLEVHAIGEKSPQSNQHELNRRVELYTK
ncbi:OmpA family protein [Photobacterium leiognathi]|uniref:OmpA family protein n=1 Tax=Photobacterium leiognathi TaxID=553611 RepID=UPI001EDF9D0E|nr:OmpA family protein [Photobacterium leiognathi]MCG3885606.1 OmpA family protein [Photobacterium leiognathi]